MSASLIQAPIEPPPFSMDGDWRKQEKDYIDRLAMRARARGAVDPDNLIGRVIRWQRADGYASYMVWQASPLKLVHLDLGDGYTVEPALLRGLTLAEVKRIVAWEDRWHHATVDVNEEFYGSLKVGQIVHYHDSFGRFVRCEVVSAPGWKSKLGSEGVAGIALKPIALIGKWAAYDLPRRLPNGEVRMGYHAEQIRDGELMQPHAGNIYENPTFKAGTAFAHLDPRTMDPLDLMPPAMTDAEQRVVPLAQAIDAVRLLVNDTGLPYTEESLRAMLGNIRTITEV